MFNFHSRKTKKTVSIVIVLFLVLALIIPILAV